MKKYFVVLSLLFGVIAGVPSHAQDKFTVLLDWYLNPDHAPLIVALQNDYFLDAGLDVELVEPADPNAPPKLVAAKAGDVAVSYQPQLQIQVDQGLPLIRIGTLVATPLNCIVVLESSDILEVSQLRGRKIGYSVAGFEDILLAAVLEKNQVSLDDVELINVNFSLSPAIMAGQVDAVIGAFRNFEINQMDLNGVPGRAFFLEEEGIPTYDELIYVAHSDRATDERLRKFIDATERAVQFILNHPEDAWQAFVSYDGNLDNELNRLAWRDTLPRFALRPGALDKNRYRKFAEFLQQRGLINVLPDLESYAVELP